MFFIKTKDNKILKLDERYAFKSNFLKDLVESIKIEEPINILIDYDTFSKVYAFMLKDSHTLKNGYNPLEIHFSAENMAFMASMTAEDIIKITSAANYLNYPFLMELGCKFISNELSTNSKSELAEIVKGTRKLEHNPLVRQDFELFEDENA